MTHFVMDSNSYTILFIIAVIWVILTAVLQQIFPSYSKKEHRELWERYHPNEPIPEKYKYILNDPYDEKNIKQNRRFIKFININRLDNTRFKIY